MLLPPRLLLQAWHPARWASRMYRMDAAGYAYDAATGAATFSFAEGGYQDARGSNDAGDWCGDGGGASPMSCPPHCPTASAPAHPLQVHRERL